MFEQTSKTVTIMIQLFLTILAVLFAAPLIIMFKVSLQGEGIGNYAAVLKQPMISRFFLNSIIVSICTIVIVYITTMLAAYAFSKLELRGKGFLFNACLVGLMVPSIALLVPLFLTIKSMHLFNNFFAVIGPISAFTIPFTLLLVRNFLDEIPGQLLDAARIDGCNSFTMLLHIMLPLSKPISVVVVIWTFLGSWNEYLLGLVFMRSDDMKLITQAPQFFAGQYTADTGKIFASLVLISLPVMIAYLLLQRYFEDGLTSGSLK
jgi:raffinose/stachyose/melibiose transport system permease protein